MYINLLCHQVVQTNPFTPTHVFLINGEKMVRPEKIHGKKVVTFKGLLMGEVDGIEIDENNWTITEVDVSLAKEMEKLFDIKSGIMSKSIVPLPVSIMGPIGEDSITLKQEITDPKQIIEQATSHRQKLLHR
jgi:sporulation protein YlmC with PRC-barrel domain